MIRGTFRQYFYPRPPRGGRPVFPVRRDADRDDFYPRPPRGGRHLYEVFAPALRDEFLSTPSARRATWHGGSYWFWPGAISIHALREEGDDLPGVLPDEDKKFLSTPSARRATRPLRPVWPRRGISIHALREEGDPPGPARTTPMSYFYPRPPRGGRR